MSRTCAYLVQGSSALGLAFTGPAKSVFAFHSFGSSVDRSEDAYLITGAQVKLSYSTLPRQSVTKSIISPALTSNFSSLVAVLPCSATHSPIAPLRLETT